MDLESDRFLLRLMNLSHQQINLQKGTEVAHCNVINAIVPIEVETPGASVVCFQRVKALEVLPTHLRGLYDRSMQDCQNSGTPKCISFYVVTLMSFLPDQMILGVLTLSSITSILTSLHLYNSHQGGFH